ncbi:hypothetical protein QQF64_012900 [Cirrhinus molitorella]|uniref:Uncharacterized protein n=1 Tax=Cirrhinus molitorella TaxID=172907 RepID=A0ABR3LPK1_9TELE
MKVSVKHKPASTLLPLTKERVHKNRLNHLICTFLSLRLCVSLHFRPPALRFPASISAFPTDDHDHHHINLGRVGLALTVRSVGMHTAGRDELSGVLMRLPTMHLKHRASACYIQELEFDSRIALGLYN